MFSVRFFRANTNLCYLVRWLERISGLIRINHSSVTLSGGWRECGRAGLGETRPCFFVWGVLSILTSMCWSMTSLPLLWLVLLVVGLRTLRFLSHFLKSHVISSLACGKLCQTNQVMSDHVKSCHVESYQVMSCHAKSCRVMPCHAMSCMPCHAMSCHVMPCHVMSCHVM